MRIVVTGATGNIGTSVVQALAAKETVADIVGVARRVAVLNDVSGAFNIAADPVIDRAVLGELIGANGPGARQCGSRRLFLDVAGGGRRFLLDGAGGLRGG